MISKQNFTEPEVAVYTVIRNYSLGLYGSHRRTAGAAKSNSLVKCLAVFSATAWTFSVEFYVFS